jgi:hypothetical protein
MASGGKTAGVVFVADDLVAWLVGLLADVGRKKLTVLVLGSDQERALRQAAAAAVDSTARAFDPSGGDRAARLAMVVSEVFREPPAGAALAGQATLLEAMQAEIAERLAVLDDATVTARGSRRRRCSESRAACWPSRWLVTWCGRSWSVGPVAGRWRRWLIS